MSPRHWRKNFARPIRLPHKKDHFHEDHPPQFFRRADNRSLREPCLRAGRHEPRSGARASAGSRSGARTPARRRPGPGRRARSGKTEETCCGKTEAEPKPEANLKDVIYLDTKDGRVVIQLRPDLAPKNVAQVEQLTKMGFYNGLTFHRVIAGFMAQTGDPTGTGAGGSQLPNLPAEFSTSVHYLRGTVGMARTEDPNSANSQFFICYAAMPSLDGQYTIIGQVTQGMEFIDAVKKGSGDNGMVTDPDRIIKMQLASDAGPTKKKVASKPKKPGNKVAKKTPKPAPKPDANAGANPGNAARHNPAPAGDDNSARGGGYTPAPGGGETAAVLPRLRSRHLRAAASSKA